MEHKDETRAAGNAKARFLATCAVLVVVYMGFSFAFNAFADPPGTPYAPGATLSPTCSPTSTNCTVYPALYGTSTLPIGGVLYINDASGTVTANTSTLYWNSSQLQLQLGNSPKQSATSSMLLLGPFAMSASNGNPSGTYIGVNQIASSDFINFEYNSSSLFNVGPSGDLEIGTGTIAASNALLTIGTTTDAFAVFSNGTVIAGSNITTKGALIASSTGATQTTSTAMLLLGNASSNNFNTGSGTWFGINTASTSQADLLDFTKYNTVPNSAGSVFRVSSSGALTVSSTAFSIFVNLSSTKFTFSNATSVGNLSIGSLIIGTTTATSTSLLTIATQTPIFRVLTTGIVLINGTSTAPLGNATTSLIVCARNNCDAGTGASSTSALAFFASPDGTQTSQSIAARGYITGGLADVGEFIPVDGGDSAYGQGDVVEPEETSTLEFQKTNSAYDPHVAGVITTTAGLIAGGGQDSHGSTVIALAGRVPVNVTMENGQIHVGDFITTSDIPGVAMRSTAPGRVIGMALADDLGDPNNPNATSQVMMFVNPSWSLGSLTSSTDIASSSWALQQTSGGQFVIDQFTAYVQAALAKLGVTIANGIVTLQQLIASKVSTDELCVQGTCVNGNQLANILNSTASGVSPGDNTGNDTSTPSIPPPIDNSSTGTSGVSDPSSTLPLPPAPAPASSTPSTPPPAPQTPLPAAANLGDNTSSSASSSDSGGQ